MYSISNNGYPGNCEAQISLPVIEDGHGSMAVTLPFRGQLRIGENFSFTMDQAIQAADRHLYIHGKPDNPLAFVEDWINLLRWEVNNLWSIDVPNSHYERNTTRNLTHEHYKRSGEILAEGIAIAFLEETLGVPRQSFYFISGSDARPDFVIQPASSQRMALAYAGSSFFLEVRSRSGRSMRNLHDKDREDLTKKKSAVTGIAGVLAVYCMYGQGKHKDDTARSRIHLADPPVDEASKLSEVDTAAVAISHYLRLTSQLGLWDHRDHLLRAAEVARKGSMPTAKMNITGILPTVKRLYEDAIYRGRMFSDLQWLAAQQPTTLDEKTRISEKVSKRIKAGDLGSLVFRGINVEVIELIEQARYLELAKYCDPKRTKQHKVDLWVRSDGLYRYENPVIPGTNEANDLIDNL